MGRGCGQVVNVLTFYSDNPSSKLMPSVLFSKVCAKRKKINEKDAGDGPFKTDLTETHYFG